MVANLEFRVEGCTVDSDEGDAGPHCKVRRLVGFVPLPSALPFPVQPPTVREHDSMYRFSRQIFMQIKDAIDPHPDTIPAHEARRRVLRACEETIERLAKDPRYFPKPARSLFQEIRCYFPITEQGRVYYSIERTLTIAHQFIQDEIERSGEGTLTPCRATTRKGKPCQRTPLPGKEYCPSHQHLEEPVFV
jgi:hypothetical protein